MSSLSIPCNEVGVLPQIGPTCWMNTILACLLYSDGLRKLTSKSAINYSSLPSMTMLKAWIKKDIKLNNNDFIEFYNEFDVITFIENLHLQDKKTFYHDPKTMSGCSPTSYIGPLFHLINLNHVSIVCMPNNKESHSNERPLFYAQIQRDAKKRIAFQGKLEYPQSPDVLFIYYHKDPLNNHVQTQLKGLDLFSLNHIKCPYTADQETIIYKGYEYVLDCKIMNNIDDQRYTKHVISLITCNKKKYMYNGWLVNNKPCPLRKYDWENDHSIFGIQSGTCKIFNNLENNNYTSDHPVSKNDESLQEYIQTISNKHPSKRMYSNRYMQSKHFEYIMIYVKKGPATNTNSKKSNVAECSKRKKDPSPTDSEKKKNEKGKQKVNAHSPESSKRKSNTSNSSNSSNSDENSPTGKDTIFNPITGRYIDRHGATAKKLFPDGKYILRPLPRRK